MNFDPQKYRRAVAELLAIDAPHPLVPKQPVTAAKIKLAALDHAALFGEAKVADREMADACLSGLWLRFDFLDRSHTISQDIHTATGSYWHGIMHRREPDWSNSKYWFRHVGDHAIFPDLLAATKRLARASQLDSAAQSLVDADAWDPYAFVDLCQQAVGEGGELESFCQTVQLAEWQLLFDYCYDRATP